MNGRRVARGLYWTLTAISAVIVVLFCMYKMVSRRPDVVDPVPPAISQNPADPAESQLPAEADPTQLVRKKDTWTCLIIAEDQASGSADTIMVAIYDTANQKAGLVSVPRDTLVVRKGWKYHKLNAAYSNGNSYFPPDGGIREIRAAVSEVLGIPLDYYVQIDTEIFVDLVNAVDGIDFNVPIHMSYDDPVQDLHIHFEPGMQHLDGHDALMVARCRQNSDGPNPWPNNIYSAYPDADIGRTRTQQELMKTIAKKVMSKPHKLKEYVKVFSEHVQTDLSLANMLWFVKPALGFDFDNLVTGTLPGDGMATYYGQSCYALDAAGCVELLNSCLNPYTTPITADMLTVISPD